MGTLDYGFWSVGFDDRVLTHLQIVLVNRLRRGDSTLVSWIDASHSGNGRSSIWVSTTTPVRFRFDEARVTVVDRAWIERLESAAATVSGLLVIDASGVPVRAEPKEVPRSGLPKSVLGRRG